MDEIINKLKERLKEAQAELSAAEARRDHGFEAYHRGRTLELTYVIKYLELQKERT